MLRPPPPLTRETRAEKKEITVYLHVAKKISTFPSIGNIPLANVACLWLEWTWVQLPNVACHWLVQAPPLPPPAEC